MQVIRSGCNNMQARRQRRLFFAIFSIFYSPIPQPIAVSALVSRVGKFQGSNGVDNRQFHLLGRTGLCVGKLNKAVAVDEVATQSILRPLKENDDADGAGTPNSRVEFADEVLRWLDRQPEVSYRRVELPSNILAAFPQIRNTRSQFVELERKHDKSDGEIITSNKILLHLIPAPTRLEECLPPKFQKDITDYFNQYRLGDGYEKEYTKTIHLHQDIWNSKREIVRHRLMAQLGLGVHTKATAGQQQKSRNATMRRIFARKTTVRRISSPVAMEFLDHHHLWGATKAKHNYGLFIRSKHNNDEELVAVATFSSKRKITRMDKQHRSHELLRFCSKRGSNVVGGISKLMKAFVTDKAPDDIVTVVDRDWGDGSGWHSLGFHSVATMDPIVMVVCRSNDDTNDLGLQRRHLIGAGIKSSDSNDTTSREIKNKSAKRPDRIGLSNDMLEELDACDSLEEIHRVFSKHNHFPVYDTGVERLMKVISYDSDGKEVKSAKSTVVEMWRNSNPTYAKDFYSPNLGIATLLKHISKTSSALPLLVGEKSLI